MYNTTSLDELAVVVIFVSLVIFLAVKGELFRGW